MAGDSSFDPNSGAVTLDPAQGGPGPGVRPPAYGYGSNLAGDAEAHLLDYVRVLYKRRWLATTVLLVVVLGAAVYAFTATPLYQARVQILIEKENTNVVSFKEAFEQNQIADDYYQTQYKILQSRALARRTIDALQLWQDPLLRPDRERVDARRLVLAPFVAAAAWLQPAGERAAASETREQSRVIDRFLARLTVSPIRNSRLVDVRYESPDAAMAARVANGLAKAYIQQNLEFKFLASREASDWLGERLAEQRRQVEASEQALQRYREQTDAVALEDRQNIVVQKLADLNAALTRAKTERIQKESAYSQIRGAQEDAVAVDALPAIVANTFIQQQKAQIAQLQREQAQLAEKFGPRHPDMLKLTSAIQQEERKLQAETAKVLLSVRNEYQAALAQEQTLAAALEQQKRDALALNRKGIDYGALQRDAATNRQVFESLLQRAKETGISSELKTSNIRVVDPAETPQRPASPNVPVDLLFALLGGGTLAVGAAFFFEYLDNRIKSPEEIRAHLGLPFLGMVPALFERAGAGDPLMNDGVPPSFAEAFRAIRTNVLFSSAADGPKTLVVTSTGPSEGKTLVSANLAVALAQTGQRVLLVDADMRRPRVHDVFQQPQEPGLSNVLVGNAKASETVRTTAVPGLWSIPAGMIPPNPAELLGSKRFAEFTTTLGEHFDWVIFDTPPVMAVTDSAIAAHVVGGVVFVLGSEMTSRQAALRSVEQLASAKAKFVGAVLNRVDLQHHGYYYSQYYRRQYGDYYSTARATN